MARVTRQGIEPTTLPQYVEHLNGLFRSALDQDLDLAPETPQGQLVGLLAQICVELDEAVVAMSNGLSLSRALGGQMDDLGSLLGIARLADAHSTVEVTLTGAPGTVIREGAKARTQASDIFALTSAAAIDTEGTARTTMQAVESGPVPAPAGTLTEIVDLIVGWTGITNPIDATLGRNRETDVAYRARYHRTIARHSRSGTDAVRAAVSAVKGVEDAIIRENDTGESVTQRGYTLPPHSISVIVDGAAEGVAEAIYRTKAPGTRTIGNSSVEIALDDERIVIHFSIVIRVPLTVMINTTLLTDFPGDGVAEIKTRVADWFAGAWRIHSNDFDTNGVGIGEPLDANRLLSPIQSVPGHKVSSVTVARKVPLVGSRLTGGAHDDLATLQAITDGALTLDGTDLTGIDLSATTDLAGVASILQTALRDSDAPKFDEAVVAYDDDLSAFTLTLGFDDDGASYQVGDYPTGTTATSLGLTEAAGASITQQPRSQTVTDVSGVLLLDRLTVRAEDVDVSISN